MTREHGPTDPLEPSPDGVRIVRPFNRSTSSYPAAAGNESAGVASVAAYRQQYNGANDVEELLDVTLTAREQITLHAGLASAAQTMLAMAADAGGPAGLARWLRYRVDRAEACGDFRAVVRLMSIIGAIAGLQAAVTPEEMESRIAGVRGFDKHRRRRAKQRTKKARQHHKGTTGQESSDAAG